MKTPLRLLSVLALTCSIGVAQAATPHPLDPLTWEEHWSVLEILHKDGKTNADTRYNRIAISPPKKASVWSWKAGQSFKRLAEVRLKQGPKAIEALVDIQARKVLSWTVREGVQPAWLIEEFLGGPSRTVMKDPKFLEALKKRGIDNPAFLNCGAMPPGNFEEEKYQGRRIAMVRCDPVNGIRNLFVRRVEGLTALIDVNTYKVIEIDDYELVQPAKTKAEYTEADIGPLRSFPTPIEISQPEGPGYKRDGYVITWDKWRFHIRSDQRVGTVISTATWRDGDRERPVMYEGHLSEIFVPYMDPKRDWYTRTVLDAGEYSMDGVSSPLTPGIDCPENALFLNSLITSDDGRPTEKENVICVFERTPGNMSWRHAADGRPKRELVARMATDLGNYDYIFDWVFETDGQIKVAVGATGIVAVQNTAVENASSPENKTRAADAYGRFVDKNVVAINHDHYFSFRIDLDVDGPANSFVLDKLTPETLPQGHPRKTMWVTKPAVAKTEQDGQLSMHDPDLWRVINPARKNHVGYPTSYQIMMGMTSRTVMHPEDIARQRAGFIDHDLWITPYKADERYAAGEYAVLSKPGMGLPQWTAANRSVENTDIVVWPTIGMHHQVRSEDWPVMPVLWHEITLRPFDFYDRNPALDLSKKP
jgi:primary-amine oxidase